jgi:hypothetical protein
VSNGKGAQLQAQGTWSAGEADNKKRFLADLRALRDRAVLDFEELAARAHYPSDVLKEAEHGPTLPTLPILAAYVRACDGDVPEWEERWRRLEFDSRADDGLPIRPAGASPAAVAGARAGVSVAPPDAYDPERIRAALRGSQGRSDHDGRGAATRAASGRRTRGWGSVTASDSVADSFAGSVAGPGSATAEPRVPDSPASWRPGTSWDETASWDTGRDAETTSGWGADAGGWSSAFRQDADPVTGLNGTPGNGDHRLAQPGGVASDAMVIETPDLAQADAIRRDPFSADWLHDAELTSPPGIEPGWSDQTEAEAESEQTAAATGSWFTPRETADHEQSSADTDVQPSRETADGWFIPRDRADDDLALPEAAERGVEPVDENSEPTIIGFWTPSAAASAPASAPVPASAPAPAPASASAPVPASASASTSASAPAPTSASAPATSAPAEAQRPGPPSAADPTLPRASWTAAAESLTSDPPDATSRTAAGPAEVAVPPSARTIAEPAASARTIAEPDAPPGPVVLPRQPRHDRLYPVRLLVVIVVAALIGSILVLLLR